MNDFVTSLRPAIGAKRKMNGFAKQLPGDWVKLSFLAGGFFAGNTGAD